MIELLDAWLSGDRVPPVAELVGAQFLDYADGRARMALDAASRHHNAMGTVHGGVLCDLADMAIGAALATRMDEGEGFTTLNLDANYLRPVIEGRVIATATVLRKGRRTALVTCRVTHDDEHIAEFVSNCLVLSRSD